MRKSEHFGFEVKVGSNHGFKFQDSEKAYEFACQYALNHNCDVYIMDLGEPWIAPWCIQDIKVANLIPAYTLVAA